MAQNIKKGAVQPTALSKSEAFVNQYKDQLIIGVVAFVVIVAGVLSYRYGYSLPREEKASEAFGKCLLQNSFNDSTSIQLALKGDEKTMGLERIAKEYGGTSAGNMAKYVAGVAYLKLGQTKQAIEWLEDFSPCSDNSVSAIAVMALGHAYATDGQLDAAVKAFKKAAGETKVADVKAQALTYAAYVLESQGKKAEALAVYEDIKKQCPEAAVVMPQPYTGGTIVQGEIDKFIEAVK